MKNRMKMVKSTTEIFPNLEPVEAAYLAGLIDGEGAIFVSKNHKKSGIGFHYNILVVVVNTSTVIIDLCNKYGGTYQAQEHTVNWKTVYRWFFNRGMVRHYLPQIFPYLKIKTEQAKVAFKLLEVCRGTGYDRTPEEATKIEQYRQELMALNARGKKKGRLE